MKSHLSFVATLFALTSSAVEVSSRSMSVTIGEQQPYAVTSITAAGDRTEFVSRNRSPLFRVTLFRTDDPASNLMMTAQHFRQCRAEKTADGATLSFSDPRNPAVASATCSIRPDGDCLNWRIAVKPGAGWSVEKVCYPCLELTPKLGGNDADDAIVTGTAKGGVWRRPAANKIHFTDTAPGRLAAQFACFYDDERLLYIAAKDPLGYPKSLGVSASSTNSIWLAFAGFGNEPKEMKLEYDITTRILLRKGEPLAWQDAADIYREWAEGQRWCACKFRERPDIPAWMKDAPVMTRFDRDALGTDGKVEEWFAEHYPTLTSKKIPLIVALWGWEKPGYWVSDYFPPYPNEERFREIVRVIRHHDGHVFPWPSGFYWTITCGPMDGGDIKDKKLLDQTAEYDRLDLDSHACRLRSGKPHRRQPRWLHGGESTCLCVADSFSRKWWNDDICLTLAKLGCEMVQVDQNVGGKFIECWNPAHGHPAGQGRWETEEFRKALVEMRETMSRVEPDAVVGFEEPCELFNDRVGIQDYRSCESYAEDYASVFNYIYHEYVPCFQSNPRRQPQALRRVWLAHSAADGQIPRITISERDYKGFKRNADDDAFDRFLHNWIALYRGEGREFLAYGRQIRPPTVLAVGRQPYKFGGYNRPLFEGTRPMVFHSAWRAKDGREALMFVNATAKPQTISYRWRGKTEEQTLAPDELRLVPQSATNATPYGGTVRFSPATSTTISACGS